jgi:hypothetical protein
VMRETICLRFAEPMLHMGKKHFEFVLLISWNYILMSVSGVDCFQIFENGPACNVEQNRLHSRDIQHVLLAT